MKGRHRFDGPLPSRPFGAGVGERVPDFCRHDAMGKAWFLYDLVDGRPIVVVACRNLDPGLIQRTHVALHERLGARARALAIVAVPPVQLKAAGFAADASRLVLADDGTVIEWLLGPASSGTAAALLLLDSNQRVTTRIELDTADPETSVRQLDALVEQPVAAPTTVVTGGAPCAIRSARVG